MHGCICDWVGGAGDVQAAAPLPVLGALRAPAVRVGLPPEEWLRSVTVAVPAGRANATSGPSVGLQFGDPPWLPDLIGRFNLTPPPVRVTR